MKFLFLSIIFLLFTPNLFGQSGNAQNASDAVGVEEIYLAKDDGEGAAGEAATSFATTDIPIYCVVQLDSMAPATVKMNLIAVSVKGVKPGTNVVTTSYKTNGRQNRVNFTGSPDGAWTAGNYRVDIFIDGKLARSQDFEIKGASGSVKGTNSVKPSPKTTKPKRIKKTQAARN